MLLQASDDAGGWSSQDIQLTVRKAGDSSGRAACWDGRPRAFTPEREHFEKHELKEARAEVRAAWIEAANLHGISPDRL